MKVNVIVARSIDNVIGVNGKIPWHIPQDFEHFKLLTRGNAVAMGRKTWDSLPKRPLGERTNIVLTTRDLDNINQFASGVVGTANSLEQAIEVAKSRGVDELFVIGGEAIYVDAIDIADTLYITEVSMLVDPPADAEVAWFNYQPCELIWGAHQIIGGGLSKDWIPFTILKYDRL